MYSTNRQRLLKAIQSMVWSVSKGSLILSTEPSLILLLSFSKIIQRKATRMQVDSLYLFLFTYEAVKSIERLWQLIHAKSGQRSGAFFVVLPKIWWMMWAVWNFCDWRCTQKMRRAQSNILQSMRSKIHSCRIYLTYEAYYGRSNYDVLAGLKTTEAVRCHSTFWEGIRPTCYSVRLTDCQVEAVDP